MMKKIFLLGLAAFPLAFAAHSPLLAQNEDVGAPLPEGQEVETIAVEGDGDNDDLSLIHISEPTRPY